MGLGVLKDLKDDRLEVHIITTDPGTQECRDPAPHRFKTSFRSQLVAIMLAVTKAQRENFSARFAIDLSMWCTAEVNQAHQTFPGDSFNVRSCLSYIEDAIVCCFMGFH